MTQGAVNNFGVGPTPAPLITHGDLEVDLVAAGGVYTPLVELSISTMLPMVLLVGCMSGVVAVSPQMICDLTIDGVSIHSGGTGAANGQCLALNHAVRLAPGPHTFGFRMTCTAGGVVSCRPVTQPLTEFAALTVLQGFQA